MLLTWLGLFVRENGLAGCPAATPDPDPNPIDECVGLEPLTATADAEMLWHALSNLVNNAVKFAAAGERLSEELEAMA